MIIRSGTFHMFDGKQVSEFLERKTQEIRNTIQKEPEDFILNVNEEEYIQYLVATFTIETPNIDFEGMFIDYYEKEIPAEEFPQGVYVRPGKTYPKQVIVYHLPFTGNEKLFHFTPREFQFWYPYVFIESNCVCFEFVIFGNDLAETQTRANQNIESIKFFMTKLTQEADAYNAPILSMVEGLFKARKQMFLDNRKMFASLGVPLRKRDDLPKTYAIPTPQNRKPLLVKPSVTEKGYQPEATLDQATYLEILQVIHDMGKVFETLPATYINKGEEDLRDHLLLQLAPRFKNEGTMTGETFSKVGKTDILYRYNNSNVFLAECKFWKGQAQYLETISQLLSYLTWRDSKAAVIMFVKNKEMSSVLESVRQVTPQHSNYLGFVNEQDTSWFNYRFHINDDPNREVKLAIMLYHIPDVYSGRVKQS